MMKTIAARDRLSEIQSGTHAVIDLDRYAANLRTLSALAGEDKTIMAIVKANAYGHGASECARAAVDAGCSYLGVARIDEALQIRKSGIAAPILVIGPPNPAQIGIAFDNDIALTVATEASVEQVLDAAARRQMPAIIHVKIDTGLHRYGAMPALAVRLARQIESSVSTILEGVYTHYSSADEEDSEPTRRQIALFERAVADIHEAGIRPALIHNANSAATITGLFPGSNMVRAGIASYGLDPSDEIPAPNGIGQIISLKTVLTRRFVLGSGESVSYNRTYTAKRDIEAGAVPIGYADGIERHLSNRGWFVWRGEVCPIIGRVCMDQSVAAVPDGAREGDMLTVIGNGEDGSMTVAAVGEMCGTNTYEPVTRIAARVPRLYLRSGVPDSWSVPILGESGRL
jgi:alanine racemase